MTDEQTDAERDAHNHQHDYSSFAFHIGNDARSGRIWQARISGLNYRPARLDSVHGFAARGPGHDAPQRHSVSPGAAAAVHFRAALPPDAFRRVEFAPHVLRGDATARTHARNAVRRGRTWPRSGFGVPQRWVVEPRPAGHHARGIDPSRALQAVPRA